MDGIKEFDIKTPIENSVIDLFNTMLSMEVETSDDNSQQSLDGQKISGSLSLAGKLMGGLNIQVSENFARLMTAAMLGMEIEEIEGQEEINDVILEACNIIGGNLKSSLNDTGLPCVISTPSITSGNDFQIETLNMERYERFVFTHQENDIIVEVCMKNADDSEPDTKRKLTSIDLNKFKRLDIIASTGDSVIELFDTMLSMDVELADEAAEPVSGTPRIIGSIDFAGDVMGSINIQVSETFAHLISAAMLETDLEKIEDDIQIKDVIGEVANIIAGNLKSGFCESGLPCEISPPFITSGNDFKIETLNMDRYENFAFHYQDNIIFVEVCVKIDENSHGRDEMGSESKDSMGEQDTTVEDTQKSIDDFIATEAPASMDISETEFGSDSNLSETNERLIQPEGVITSEEDENNSERRLSELNLDLILDVPVEISVELGQTKKRIDELLSLGQGSVLEFSNLAGEPVDILVNQTLIARGDVVVDKEKYGIRILEISSRRDRIESLR